MEYDMELHANGKQYGIAFERNGKLFQNDDIDYNIYSFYINGEKIGEFGHTYPKKATFNINKYLPLIEKMVHNEGAIWGWEKANAINKSKRTIKLSESRLREIITESVKMVISELDWKTTSNASDKQSLGGYAKGDDGKAAFKRNFARKGGIDRYFKFRDYTDNAANRKFFGQEGGVDFLPNDNASDVTAN